MQVRKTDESPAKDSLGIKQDIWEEEARRWPRWTKIAEVKNALVEDPEFRLLCRHLRGPVGLVTAYIVIIISRMLLVVSAVICNLAML